MNSNDILGGWASPSRVVLGVTSIIYGCSVLKGGAGREGWWEGHAGDAVVFSIPSWW